MAPRLAQIAYDFDERALVGLRQRFQLSALNQGGTVWPRPRNEAAVAGAHAILVGARHRPDRALLDAAGPQLMLIASNSVGYDHLTPLVPVALERGIGLTHTPEVLSPAVAEQVFVLMGQFLRRPAASRRAVVEGRFVERRGPLMTARGFAGLTLGIVGLGSTGGEVARRAHAFDMKLLGTDIDPARPHEYLRRSLPIERVGLAELLERADIVTLHVDLNETSRGLIGPAELARMKPDAGLVNTSRGPVVQEAALVAALEARQIAWAALDVFEHEPRVHPGLIELAGREGPEGQPLVWLSPHVASGTVSCRRGMAARAARNLRLFFEGADPWSLDLIPPLRRGAAGLGAHLARRRADLFG